ncbi:hypothetical protein NESM_000358300 [Novymonas esmeraldas]|uniref:Methyltransferase n=1 Tax=Novymonas esmeraldas TaxID=1808958 RepID=A0AAW0ELZ5_9TRYP
MPVSVEHQEDFDVVTSPDGTSSVAVHLACATATEHYRRTTTAYSTVATDPADVCSTGLRVYEGAQVLAAFVYRFAAALVPPQQSCAVVELGCGCGLVSFTLDHVLRTAHASASRAAPTTPTTTTAIICTDASEDCLTLVHRSGALMGRSVSHIGGAVEPTPVADAAAVPVTALGTFRLAWSDDGVDGLLRQLACRLTDGGATAVPLVLGSDLMYYRVDVNALLRTARRLLLASSSTPAAGGLIVFAHFMRIPDGERTLAAIAREQQQLAIAAVPLTAFLSAETVAFRGWGGLQLVLLCPQHLCAPVEHGDDSVATADVVRLQRMLHTRADAMDRGAGTEATATTTTTAAAAAQAARYLAAALTLFPSPAARPGHSNAAGEVAEQEAEALMHALL